MRKILLLVLCTLGGCAALPPVALRYYAPRAATTVSVERSIVCDKSRSAVLISDAVAVDSVVGADPRRPYVFPLDQLGGGAGAADIAFKLSPDGRLLAVNSEVDGMADNAIRPALSLAVLALRGAGALAEPASGPCELLARWAGDKPLGLRYVLRLDSDDTADISQPLPPAPASRGLHALLLAAPLPLPALTLRATLAPLPPAAAAPDDDAAPSLALPATAALRLVVRSGADVIADQVLTVPAAGSWRLPLPRAAWFGQRQMALTLSDAGAVTSLHYGKTGASAGLSAGLYGAALSATAPAATPADAVAALKAQSDLIVQQQRLLLCQARPADCK